MAIWKQLFVLVAIVAAGFWAFDRYGHLVIPESKAEAKRERSREITIEVATAERRTLPRNVEAVGTTRARQSVEIVPLASGRVVEVLFRSGRAVTTGEVLVRLDDDIERANLAQAEAQLVERHQAVERAEQLRRTNAIALASLEQVTAARAAAEAEVDRARRRLSDREVRAPFPGVVGLSDIDLGARVDDQTVMTTLDDLTEVEVEFSLPETLFADIAPGQTLEARSAAFPDRIFTGTVDAIDNRIDAVSRAFRVRAVVPNPEGVLPAGMFLVLALTLSETEAVVVPEAAIVVQAADTFVYVIEGTTAVRRKIETGQRQSGVVAVTAGLEPGEVVAVRGLQRLRNGSTVKIKGEPAVAATAGGRT